MIKLMNELKKKMNKNKTKIQKKTEMAKLNRY